MCFLAMEIEFVISVIVCSADGTRDALFVKSIANRGFLPYMSWNGVNPVDSFGEELMTNSADGR